MRVRASFALVATVVFALAACGGEAPKPAPPAPSPEAGPQAPAPPAPAADPQATPAGVAEAIFAAARTGQYAGLAALLDPKSTDGDVRRIGMAATGGPEAAAEFQKYFATGRVAGEVKVEGDAAEVPILFGPEGTKKETFEMVRRDGKWFLSKF